MLRNPYTWPPFLCFFFLYAAMGNFFLWSVPFLRDIYGLTTTKAALYASLPSMALLASAPITGYLSDRVLHRRKLPYTVLASGQFLVWLAFLLTLGTLPLPGVCLLFVLLGVMGGAFVLTWPLGAEVNPPGLAGIAVAVTNLGGFVGAALTQGPVGAVLDAGWTGVVAEGARVYPVASYRGGFALCALFVLAGAAITFLLQETRGDERPPPVRPARATREARPVGLEGNPERVGDERDQVVEAGQRDQLDELLARSSARAAPPTARRSPAPGRGARPPAGGAGAPAPGRRPASPPRGGGDLLRVSPTRSAKNATCTPHSYSEPQRAQVRSMTISRSRRRDRAAVEQAARHHAQEHALVARQGAEEGERRARPRA